MNLSQLKPPAGQTKSKKRIGRGQGSGQGKTAGRGNKGAKSRSGFKFKRGFECGQMPLHRRVPKRGFHNPFRIDYEVVNLDTLGLRFEAGTIVTPDLLREAGLVRDTVSGREREYVLVLDALAPLEAFLARLGGKGVWSRRLDALETEVYRVRQRRMAREPTDENKARRRKTS